MRQRQFEQQNAPDWARLRWILDHLEGGKGKDEKTKGKPDEGELGRLPWLYRRVCHHYALARSRRYSPRLIEDLHDLVQRGHGQLYRRKVPWLWNALVFLARDFPVTLRRHAWAFWLSLGLFYLPGIVMGVLCYLDSDMLLTIMDSGQVAQMEGMYDPGADRIGRPEGRASDTDFAMFGFYIRNNIGIGFQTFASGMLLGLGTAFILVFNGLMIGGVAGHLTQMGFGGTFWTFVAGHSAFELTAICISGAAGLLLARAIFRPGRKLRSEALKDAGREAVKLIIGAAVMLLLAAFVEAFWSSTTLAASLKFSVAAVLWLMVVLYLSFAGRGAHAAR